MNINIFKNYGCLGAEKRNIYTYGGEHSTATCSDILKAEVPETWSACENAHGNLALVSPWGWIYEANEVLAGNEYPCFSAIDSHGNDYICRLEVKP